jgi:predicted transcriptional regulator
MYEFYFRMQVEQGLDDIKNGRVVSHEDVIKESLTWISK